MVDDNLNNISNISKGENSLYDSAFKGRVRLITILGSTGSIGTSTIDIIKNSKNDFEVEALVANKNYQKLASQAIAVNAKLVVIADESKYADLKDLLAGTDIEVAAGISAVFEAAQRKVDIVLAAMVGAIGILPTISAIESGNNIALANKECLVSSGNLFMEHAKKHQVKILPVDSEHNAIFQIIGNKKTPDIEKIILTASGGPFRKYSIEQMQHITLEDALNHPTWNMGNKITIDSATLMNKGLELIEAHYLFNVMPEDLEVYIHPQSIIHGMVNFKDGASLAQMGNPDMRSPISYALSWPKRINTNVKRLDLAEIGTLSFEKVDNKKFPTLNIAKEAMKIKKGACNILNASNEVLVNYFLNKKIDFLDILIILSEIIEVAERAGLLFEPNSFDDVVELDLESREMVKAYLSEYLSSNLSKGNLTCTY